MRCVFFSGFAESRRVICMLSWRYCCCCCTAGELDCGKIGICCFSENDCIFNANHIHISLSLPKSILNNCQPLKFIQFSSRSCARAQSNTHMFAPNTRNQLFCTMCTTHRVYIQIDCFIMLFSKLDEK